MIINYFTYHLIILEFKLMNRSMIGLMVMHFRLNFYLVHLLMYRYYSKFIIFVLIQYFQVILVFIQFFFESFFKLIFFDLLIKIISKVMIFQLL